MSKHKILRIMLFFIIISLIVIIHPSSYVSELKGVRFNTSNKDYLNEVTIYMDGKFSRTLLLERKFVGKIGISGIRDLVRNKSHVNNNTVWINTTLKFHRKHGARIILDYDSKDKRSRREQIGEMYINDNLDTFTIILFDIRDYNSKGWSIYNGYVISAPAKTREKGLEIFNELISKDKA